MHRTEFFQQVIEEEINKISFPESPEDLYDPIRYMISIGGKRLRPALLLMAHELSGGKWENALQPALAIELFHNFTLLHDDIMDKAPLRRGQPTVHSRWNNHIAILSGDTLFVKACEMMSAVDDRHLRKTLGLYYACAAEVCEGQQYDMTFEHSTSVSVEDYISMISAKTASLLACSLAIGALTADASEEDQHRLHSFGKNLGIAFQLHDDVLDVYGDEKKFGKQTGGDIVSNKKTFLLLSAFQAADAGTRKDLERLTTQQGIAASEKVSAVKAIYSQLGIREKAEAEMERYFLLAMSNLDGVNRPDESKSVLREFAGQLMVREA